MPQTGGDSMGECVDKILDGEPPSVLLGSIVYTKSGVLKYVDLSSEGAVELDLAVAVNVPDGGGSRQMCSSGVATAVKETPENQSVVVEITPGSYEELASANFEELSRIKNGDYIIMNY